MQVGVELGSGGRHIVSSANGESSIISRCRGMFPGNAIQSSCRGMSSGRLDGDHRVKCICGKSILSPIRGMFPRYPDVVECFRGCHAILQSWNVSRAGIEGHHRKMMFVEVASQRLTNNIPLSCHGVLWWSHLYQQGSWCIRLFVVCVM